MKIARFGLGQREYESCFTSLAGDHIADQERIMSVVNRLPSRFPVGTRYVIEGRPNQQGELQITSRYVVLPNGTKLDLRVDGPDPEGTRRVRVRRTRSYGAHSTKRRPPPRTSA
jgi:hypothetical protein